MGKKTNLKTLLSASLILLGFGCATALGEVFYVDANRPIGGDGLNWGTAYKYLQDALDDAVTDDEIWVAEGTYRPDDDDANHPDGSGLRTDTFQLIDGVAIYGGFPSGGGTWQQRDPNIYETVLSGDLNGDDGPDFANNSENSYHVVTSSGTGPGPDTILLDGFTITAGNANGSFQVHDRGGGMWNRNIIRLTVINCTFSSNRAAVGGGMYNDSSSPTVINCTFNGNYASLGGGMNNEPGSPTVINCMFSGNSAKNGGGMNNEVGSPTVINCTFNGNSAGQSGGGMIINYGSPTLTNCTFSGNSAVDYGGGMYNNLNGNPTVTNCIFSGNSATYGGGMYNEWESSPNITNCTFAGNSAANGNAIACDSPQHSYPSTVQLANCILWDGGDEIWNNDGSTITITYSDVQGGWPDVGNIDADPCFVEPGYWYPNGIWVNGDYHLILGSPCIDAGDPTYVPGPNERDLDGDPRVINGRLDMGADEFANKPIIKVLPIEIIFDANEGGSNPPSQILSIRNVGIGTLNWELTEGCSWLQADPNTGSSTGETNDVTLSVDIAGLTWGVYECSLTISDPCAENTPRTVTVTLDVLGPVIELSAAEFEFSADEDGPNPPDQILTIRNAGGGILNWTIIYDCNWLLVEPNTGSSTGEVNDVTLSVDIAGLTWGVYECSLTISDPCAENNPQIVTVTLDVLGPVIELSAAEFEFSADEGGPNPPDQILTIRNAGGSTLNWTITYDCNWLSVEPNSGSSAGETNDVTLSVDVSGLPWGDMYDCILTISDPCAENTPQTVEVLLAYWWDYPVCWDFAGQCKGDCDGDAYVANLDFLALKASYTKSYPDGAYNPCADFDRDGYVGNLDFLILKDNYTVSGVTGCTPGDWNQIYKP